MITGKNVLTGSEGKAFWDGDPLFILKSFVANVDLERSDIYVGKDKDTKLNGLAGTITLSIEHVFTKQAVLLEELKAGSDPRVLLSLVIADPDAVGRQKERVNIANCWFNKFPLASATTGEHVTDEYELGFCVARDSEFAQAILGG